MATTGWIFNNFREVFDKWDSEKYFDANGEAIRMRQYHWYLERYAKQQGGGESVDRVPMDSVLNVNAIQCDYMGSPVNIATLANFIEGTDPYFFGSDGNGRLEDRVISYQAQSEAGVYLITESWEGLGPQQYWDNEQEDWLPVSEGGLVA